jgi:hypothetical protein
MNINLKDSILFIIIFILGFIVLYKCEPINQYSEKEHYRDTITYVKTTLDTNWFDTTITRTQLKYKEIKVYYTDDSSKVYRFKSEINDSLISGNLVTGIKIKDTNVTLVGQYLDYTPKFPKYIYRTDSVFTTIKDCTIVFDNKMNFLVGGNIDLGANTTLTPTIGLQLKNKTYIEAGYNPFNKTILVGAKFKIF